MSSAKIAITVDESLLREVDRMVREGDYGQAFLAVMREKIPALEQQQP